MAAISLASVSQSWLPTFKQAGRCVLDILAPLRKNFTCTAELGNDSFHSVSIDEVREVRARLHRVFDVWQVEHPFLFRVWHLNIGESEGQFLIALFELRGEVDNELFEHVKRILVCGRVHIVLNEVLNKSGPSVLVQQPPGRVCDAPLPGPVADKSDQL